MSDIPTTAQRRAVEERAGGYCEYCHSPTRFGVQSFECEHIIPISQGGQTILDNLAWACGGCNRCKANRTSATDPDSNEMVPLFNPRSQKWSSHFAWSHDYTLIIGLTTSGRATIQALRLNRPGVVNLRRVLLIVGEHPLAD